MRLENCTADTRTLIAPLRSGARAILTLKPGEISRKLDQEVVDVLRTNPAVEWLFRHKLVRVVTEPPKSPSPQLKAASDSPKPEGAAKKGKKGAPKKGKGKKGAKLDLGLGE